MSILVTGANGYLGNGIVTQLLNNGCDVIAADFTVDRVDSRAKKIECNLFEIEDPYCFFGEPDTVLHLAWKDGFIHNSDSHIESMPLHHHFLKKMFEGGVDTVAVMGTMHEIGFYEGCIKDDTPCNPMSLYGIAKNALRKDVELLANTNNKRYQWLRGFYIVGNTPFGSSIFSKIVQAENNGQIEFPFTMGQNQYDFLNYEDFCGQVAATVQQKNINGIINICSGKPEKLANRVERFIRENNFKIKLKYGAFPDRPYDSKAVWGDDSKIKEIMTK